MTKQSLQQNQRLNLSPQQLQFLSLLQIPITELEKRIEKEIEDNPALEEDEDDLEKIDKTIFNYKSANLEYQIEDKSDSLADSLKQQLSTLYLTKKQDFLVLYLIDSLDDNGFLNRDLYSISSDLLVNFGKDIKNDELEESLKILQSLDPIGSGARNLKECLLIQLKNIYPEKKLEINIIFKHYKQFSNKNFEYLSKKLNVSLKEIKKAYLTIEGLNPIPSSGFSKNTTAANYIYPDFTVSVFNEKLEMKLNQVDIKPIKVSQYYKDMLTQTKSIDTQKFLKDSIEKANWFKQSIIKRNDTLKNVFAAILNFQKKYFKSGVEKDLKPMRLADIAQIVNMDISTISRVSNSKYVSTQFGTFKLKELFSEAYRKEDGEIISTKEIKKTLKKIVENENKIRPFSDDQLAEMLGKEEYHIARRTVSKYRENLGIQTARLRRKL